MSMMSDFLADNNVCGQTLLQIVAQGSSIIAELLRLKDFIPDPYKVVEKRYIELVMDFSYFHVSEAVDKKIESDSKLYDLDNELRHENIELLTRFYLAFDSIFQYVNELNQFVKEVNGGFYIQQSIEGILNDPEGKQLLCESLYLYGCMLLILDLHIPGDVRERLIVAYTRYSAQRSHGDSNIDEVCKLLRSTGFKNFTKRPANYPDDYFQRVPLDRTFIEMVIGRLRSDDIYNQVSVYPLPEHRPTALANQATMLCICLFFSPQTLQTQSSRMREIVDKFFPDNWIVSIYMGITISLIDAWEPYKAARTALINVTDHTNVKEICEGKLKDMQRLLAESREILKVGILNEKSVMNDLTKILSLMRELNVVLRWTMLHSNAAVFQNESTKKDLKDLVCQELNHPPMALFELMLNTSQLEFKVKEFIRELLQQRETKYAEYKRECESRLSDLSEAFSGNQPLMKIPKNEPIMKWFLDIKHEIEVLEFSAAKKSGQILIRLIRALEEVQAYHNIDSSMHVKQFLLETSDFMHQMIHMLNVKDDVLITIQLIGDFSYAWRIVDNMTPIMQESIKRQPNLVIKLRAAFLKLSSALDIPLLRINQAKSEDLVSVSQYYSNQLVDYVRKVIQIIPKTIFEILAQIIHLQSRVIREVPTKVEKDRVKDYAQLDDRFQVSKLTYSISVFTEGVLMMQKTLVGVIELDPKELLEDGIKIELVENISKAFMAHLSFGKKGQELEVQLNDLATIMDGYRRSFEYIQDYMNIKGLQIWQTEVARVVNFNVERECNRFLVNKIQAWQSKYQSTTVPIPVYDGETFIGSLAKELLRITDPKSTKYVSISSAWYDFKSSKELVNLRFFTKLIQSIGIPGLHGLDKLFAFMISSEIQELVQLLQTDLPTLEQCLTTELTPKSLTPFNAKHKTAPKTMELMAKIGQKQILRRHIAFNLHSNVKFNSKSYENSLKNFNDALILEVKTGNMPSRELLTELDEYLLQAGIYEPYVKVYITCKNLNNLSDFLTFFVLNQLSKFTFVKSAGELIAKRDIDGHPFIVGLVSLLTQFDVEASHEFLRQISVYAVEISETSLSSKEPLSPEALTIFQFLEIFLDVSRLPRHLIEQHIPDALLCQYNYLSKKV